MHAGGPRWSEMVYTSHVLVMATPRDLAQYYPLIIALNGAAHKLVFSTAILYGKMKPKVIKQMSISFGMQLVHYCSQRLEKKPARGAA